MEQTSKTFAPGQRVVILRGKFKGETGTFHSQVEQQVFIEGIPGLRILNVKSIAAA